MKRYQKTLIVFVTILQFCLLTGGIASAQSDVSGLQNYLLKNAYLYWEKGTLIQYDDPEKYDQSLYFAPEEVTQDHIIYTNCGAFVSALYWETFGIELPWRTENVEPYMRKNEDTPYVVDTMEREEYTQTVNSGGLISRIAGNIQEGDLILCRFNTKNPKGHIMMVYQLITDSEGKVTDAWLIHSTGKKDREENNESSYQNGFREGTVRISQMSKLLGGFYSKMDDDGRSKVYYYGIFRPLATPGEWLTSSGTTVSYDLSDSTRYRYGIKRNIINCSYELSTSQLPYTGSNLVPVFSVYESESGIQLEEGKDYIITYLKDDNIYPGDAFVNINGIGNYCGTKKVIFSITK